MASRMMVMGGAGMVSKLFLKLFTRLTVNNLPRLLEAIHKRPVGKPLLTVSNHTSTVDDPLMWGILPWRTLFQSDQLRWALGAEELLFTNALFRWFFSTGQVLPIRRGQGISQPAVNQAVRLLEEGRWVHIFPEGRVVADKDPWSTGKRLKWGISRLILEPKEAPLLLPLIHRGFEHVKPVDERVHLFQSVQIAIGEPIDLTDLRKEWNLIPDIIMKRSICTEFVTNQLRGLYTTTNNIDKD